jgi:photosystem II stability/assembly factor-like uncharacterized protein
MNKKFSTLFLCLVIIAINSACVAPQVKPTSTPIVITATQAATVEVPTQTAWVITATPAPTETTQPAPTQPAAGDVMQPFANGAPVIIQNIRMFSVDNGWAVGSTSANTEEHILITSDGGATWKDVNPPQKIDPAVSLNKVTAAFPDMKTAWVIFRGETPAPEINAIVWVTHDGGASWTASQPLAMADNLEFFMPAQIDWIDAQHAFLISHIGAGMSHDYVSIYSTADGGNNWQRIVDPALENIPMGCSKYGLGFLDPTHGWVGGNCNGVQAGLYLYQTSDGGKTWALANLPPPSGFADLYTNGNYVCGAEPPQFTSDKTGFIQVKCTNANTQVATSFIYRTVDGGVSWKTSSTQLPDGTFQAVNDNVAFFLGGKFIRVSKDGGQTWNKVLTVAWDGQLAFLDEQNGWVVATTGDAIALVQTTEGGAHWTEIKPTITQ